MPGEDSDIDDDLLREQMESALLKMMKPEIKKEEDEKEKFDTEERGLTVDRAVELLSSLPPSEPVRGCCSSEACAGRGGGSTKLFRLDSFEGHFFCARCVEKLSVAYPALDGKSRVLPASAKIGDGSVA